jgi:hypothetical protein
MLAELTLLDLGIDSVDGYLVQSMGLPVDKLLGQGLLKPRPPGSHVTIRVEDDEGLTALRRLPVQFNSTRTWVEDEVSGQRLDLSAPDLRSFALDRVYLRERLLPLLTAQLVEPPLVTDGQEPYFLGHYRWGETLIPVVLSSRLWDRKHADALERSLRLENRGLVIVLTTTLHATPRFLGPGVVIPIADLAEEEGAEVSLDLSKVQGEVRRWHEAATSTQKPKLIHVNKYSALLVGPWELPWTLTKREHILVVEVLVQAWNSKKRRCSKDELINETGLTIRGMDEFFRSTPEWTQYIRGADGNQRHRSWELNIG